MAGVKCSGCGYEIPFRKAIKTDGSDLKILRGGEFQGVASEKDRRQFYAELQDYALQHGFKIGWARHQFREKYGDWPSFWGVAPQPPSPATLNYIKSRQIAYAKRRKHS